jgi:hypothetical protein
VSAVQSTRSARRTPSEHSTQSSRAEKPKSAQAMQPPRRESGAAGCTGLQAPSLKNRAYSAPMVPKHHGPGPDDDDDDHLGGDAHDDDEIAGDEFFQRYHFPQTGQPNVDDVSSSSADSSSDTEGPLSPTHIKTRLPNQPTESLPSPRSPAPSVAVSCFCT